MGYILNIFGNAIRLLQGSRYKNVAINLC